MRSPEPTLSEVDVLRAYVETSSVKQAAYSIGITPQAAKNRLRRLYSRLGVSGALEATIALGWMKFPPKSPRCGHVGKCPLAVGHSGAHLAAA